MPLKTSPPKASKIVAVGLPALTNLTYWGRYSDISLRGEDAKHFQILDSKLAELCDSRNLSLPKQVHDCWEIFEFSEDTKDIVVLEKVPSFITLCEEFRGHYENELVGNVFGKLITLEALKDTKLNMSKVVCGYIAKVLLEVAKLNPSKDEVVQYRIITHLEKVIQTLFENPAIRAKLDAPSQIVLHAILIENLTPHIGTRCPVSTVIPQAMADFSQQMNKIVHNFSLLMFSLTEGGNQQELVFSTEAICQHRFNTYNPFVTQIIEARVFIAKLQDDQRVFPFEKLQAPDYNCAKKYLTDATKGARFLDHRFIRSSVNYLLLQTRVPDPTTSANAVIWAQSTDEQSISDSTVILLRLSKWLEFLLFIAHKVKDFDFILKYKGQELLLRHKEAAIIQHFLIRLDATLFQLDNEINEIYFHLNQHFRTDQSKYEHKIFNLLTDIRTSAEIVRRQAIGPLRETNNILSKLKTIFDQVCVNHFEEMAKLLQNSQFSSGFNSREFNLGLEAFKENNTFPAPSNRTQRPEIHTRKRIANQSSALNSSQAAQFRAVNLFGGTDSNQIQTQFNPKPAHVRTLTTSIPLDEGDSDEEAITSSVAQPSVTLSHQTQPAMKPSSIPVHDSRSSLPTIKLWQKILMATVGLSILTFGIVALLACNGLIALPFFCALLGVTYGGLALASIVAGGVFILGVMVTIAVYRTESNKIIYPTAPREASNEPFSNSTTATLRPAPVVLNPAHSQFPITSLHQDIIAESSTKNLSTSSSQGISPVSPQPIEPPMHASPFNPSSRVGTSLNAVDELTIADFKARLINKLNFIKYETHLATEKKLMDFIHIWTSESGVTLSEVAFLYALQQVVDKSTTVGLKLSATEKETSLSVIKHCLDKITISTSAQRTF